jgi:outer membrane protein OmpA-like peptidoglycan-associated protein
MRLSPALLAALLPGAAAALQVPLPPGAILAAEDAAPIAAPVLPTGPWAGGPPPAAEARGATTRRAWRVPGQPDPGALLEPIRAALGAEGYTILYSCADTACGGYDFRFALDLLPAPQMYVDLGDFRYLLATRGSEPGESFAAVVTSRGLGAGYVHVTAVEPADAPPTGQTADPALDLEPLLPEAPASAASGNDPAAEDLAQRLAAQGHVVLEGLSFTTGAAALAEAEYDSLRALAQFLADNPRAVVALVGHTDAIGALDANIRLSRARADAVRTRLIATHGADPARLQAEGAGYLAPVASNLTPEGRDANRRVEAVLLAND